MTLLSLQYSQSAVRALARIERYIVKSGGYPRNAANFVLRIQAFCENLCNAPLHGHNLDHRHPGLRSVGMEGCVSILYEIRGSVVRILSINYGGRQPERELLP